MDETLLNDLFDITKFKSFKELEGSLIPWLVD